MKSLNLDYPKVSVCVITYNQARYIEYCLQSIVDQRTDFTFEIIVGDDCSTDGTADIVSEFAARYPNLIKTIFQLVNTGGGENFMNVHSAANGVYIAHIDGDDYALPGKLQAQADYLDAHPLCHAVWHRAAILSDDQELRSPIVSDMLAPLHFSKADCLAIGSFAIHSSKMYRAALRENYAGRVKHQYDYELDVLQIEGGFGSLLPSVLGVYRSSSGVLSPKNNDDSPSRRALDAILTDYYMTEPEYRGHISAHFLRLAIADVRHWRAHRGRSVNNYVTKFQFSSIIFLLRYVKRLYVLRRWRRC